MDYIRFVSQSARSYAKLQSDIIRKYIKKGDFITTNGLFANLDNHLLCAESLDFITYDSYPNFAYCLDSQNAAAPGLKDRNWSRNLAETRSVSAKFGIMEQQSGANGWNTRMEAPAPKPGQMSLWAMQSIAHGADFVSFFRWRTCTMGTEIYWHGILDYSNRDNRRLAELGEFHQKIKRVSSVAGGTYEAAFAVLKDYDNVWDAKLDKWHERVERASDAGIFEAAQLCHSPMDYVYLTGSTGLDDLQKYAALFYPHAVILTEERAALLERYVENGGTLVLGCRTGYKDKTGKCPMHKLPGLARKLSGADVVDYTFVSPDDGKITVDWEGSKIEAAVFTDVLEALGNAQVVGTYTNNYYAGKGAIIRNEYGKGAVYYFGAAFNRETAAVFLEKLKIAEPWREVVEVPQSCELAVRRNEKGRFLFLLNYAKEPAPVRFKQEVWDLYTGQAVSGAAELPACGTGVYRL
jgi:beta-galactosidase